MIYVDGNKAFEEALAVQMGDGVEKDLDEAERRYNEILSRNLGHPVVLAAMGTCQLEKGNFGLAVQLLSQVTQMSPTNPDAWNNLGMAYKEMQHIEKARVCFKKGANIVPDPNILSNLASTYVNVGQPEKCLTFARKALEIDEGHDTAKWHEALALLELQQWQDAWEPHEARLIKDEHSVTRRNYHTEEEPTPYWDGKTVGRIAVHGEQGLGDEIMFLSCLPDLIAQVGPENVIVEPSPRLAELIQRSFPDVKIFGTDHIDGRDWIADLGRPDFKLPMGSLPKFFRTSEAAFPGTPYLVTNALKANEWKMKLDALGPRKKIGLAWQGGWRGTRYDLRSLVPDQLWPILHQDADFVSLQYDTTAQEVVRELTEDHNLEITHWPEAAQAHNIDDLASMMINLDLVVSVCQTCIHLAGALGIPCLVMTPGQPSWRYGVTGDMPWYNSVHLIRQEIGDNNWGPVIARTVEAVQAFTQGGKNDDLGRLQGTEPKAA